MTWVEQDIEEDDKVDTGGENSRWVGEWEGKVTLSKKKVGGGLGLWWMSGFEEKNGFMKNNISKMKIKFVDKSRSFIAFVTKWITQKNNYSSSWWKFCMMASKSGTTTKTTKSTKMRIRESFLLKEFKRSFVR